MKLNQRIFAYADEENLVEKQECGNHTVEIYRLNPYENLLNEFTAKGKFAVWSSVDGSNYRLFIEDGYYEKLKPLYQEKINTIWLDFWDDCERVTSRFRNIIMPLALLVILVAFGSNMFFGGTISLIISVVFAAIYFCGVWIYKRLVNKKITEFNSIAVGKIKNILGEKRFQKLLDDQRSYIDEYFKYDESYDEEPVENETTEVEDASTVTTEEVEVLPESEEDKEIKE